MDYEIDLHLPARPDYAVLVRRVLAELEEAPGGPGAEAAHLAPALAKVVERLLTGLSQSGGGGLDLHLEADDVRVQLDLAAAPSPGRPPSGPLLGSQATALMRGLEKAFDQVDSRPLEGGGLQLTLVRHVPC